MPPTEDLIGAVLIALVALSCGHGQAASVAKRIWSVTRVIWSNAYAVWVGLAMAALSISFGMPIYDDSVVGQLSLSSPFDYAAANWTAFLSNPLSPSASSITAAVVLSLSLFVDAIEFHQ